MSGFFANLNGFFRASTPKSSECNWLLAVAENSQKISEYTSEYILQNFKPDLLHDLLPAQVRQIAKLLIQHGEKEKDYKVFTLGQRCYHYAIGQRDSKAYEELKNLFKAYNLSGFITGISSEEAVRVIVPLRQFNLGREDASVYDATPSDLSIPPPSTTPL